MPLNTLSFGVPTRICSPNEAKPRCRFSISLDFPDLPGGEFSQLTSRREARQFGRCGMYQPPPLRGRSVFDGKKVLLIDPHQRARDVRASVLRSRGIEVDATLTASRRRGPCGDPSSTI
jgi:hypothetical protein